MTVFVENYWFDKSNIRKFFEKFAASSGFDPLSAKSWHEVTLDSFKGFKVMLKI